MSPGGEPRDVVMAKVLLHLEAEVHGDGWDRFPQLYAICGPGDDPAGWKLEALMVDPVFWSTGFHPRDVVRGYANFLSMPLPAGTPAEQAESREFVVDGLAKAPLRAVAFITEAWGIEETSGENVRSRARQIADIPGAYELREVIAVTPDSTVYMVSRRRGREPVASWLNHVTRERGRLGETTFDLGAVAGGVTRSLRRIVNVVNARAGLPLIAHVDDSCNQCSATLPSVGGMPAAVCPACGNR